MPLNFEKHAAKGNEFLNALAAELGGPSYRDSAGRILRAVFRTLRDQITPEESFELIAQLPMALKSVYIDGWKPFEANKRIRKMDEFIEEVIAQDGSSAFRDFSNEADAREAVRSVIRTLRRYISDGEARDIAAVLPRDLKQLFEVTA